MSDRTETTSSSEAMINRFRNFGTRQVLTPLVLLVAVVSGMFFVLALVFERFKESDTFLPENNLPIALVAGTVVLLTSIAVVVIVFARLDLTSWRHPLGLPEGSIRAVIALLLILLFFISAVFLYSDSSRPRTRTLTGITADRVENIETSEIIDLAPNAADPQRFDVTLAAPRNTASDDLAKQIVTTVSTLVVAIAAFYFGAKSVETAHRATGPANGGEQGDGDDPSGPGSDPQDGSGENAEGGGAQPTEDEANEQSATDEVPSETEHPAGGRAR